MKTPVGLLAVVVALAGVPAALAAERPIIAVALADDAVVAGIHAKDEDILLCALSSFGAGQTRCDWSLYLDGIAAGVRRRIRAVDVLPDGSLVLRLDERTSAPGIADVKPTDLLRFVPNRLAGPPYRSGSWQLLVDGDALRAAGDMPTWNGAAVVTDGTCETRSPMTCDLLFSLPVRATVGRTAVEPGDIVRCTPTAFSAGGAVVSCAYQTFLAGRAIGGGASLGGALDAFDFIPPNSLLFRTGAAGTLPRHDGTHDLLRYVGTVGAGAAGAIDLVFDGDTAGLAGKTIAAAAFVPWGGALPLPTTTTTSSTSSTSSSTSTTSSTTSTTSSTSTSSSTSSCTSSTSSTSSSTSTSSTSSTTLPPICLSQPEGASCGDGDICNGEEVCHAGVCGAPSSAAALACRGEYLAVLTSNFDADALAIFRPADGTMSTVPVGRGPWGVALDPRGTAVYVTNRVGNALSVIDPAAGTLRATVPVDPLPLGVVIDPSGTRLYLASFDDNVVSVMDVATLTVTARIPVKGPAGLAFDGSGNSLYAASYVGDSVAVIDVATNTVRASVPTGRRPLELALDGPRARLYVTNYESGSVSVIGTVSHTVLASIAVGRKPFGVAVDGVRGRAYVTNAASDTVSVIDTAREVVIGSVAVGRAPFGVGLDLTGAHAYVANASGNTLSVVDTAAGTVMDTIAIGQLPVAFGGFVGVLANQCPAAALDCDDADPFTADTCTAAGGCAHGRLTGVTAVRAGIAGLAGALEAAPNDTLGGAHEADALRATIAALSAELAPATSNAAALRRRLRRLGRETHAFLGTVRRGLRHGKIARDPALRLIDVGLETRAATRQAGRRITGNAGTPAG